MTALGLRRGKAAVSPTCPLGLCPHAVLHHDRDEVPGPPVERCTVPDCHCSGTDPDRWGRLAEVLDEMAGT